MSRARSLTPERAAQLVAEHGGSVEAAAAAAGCSTKTLKKWRALYDPTAEPSDPRPATPRKATRPPALTQRLAQEIEAKAREIVLTGSPWQDHAACLDADPEVFFPQESNTVGWALAKKWCRVCPVVEQCLSHALKTGTTDGVAGGMTPAERNEVVKAAKKHAAADAAAVAGLLAAAGVA